MNKIIRRESSALPDSDLLRVLLLTVMSGGSLDDVGKLFMVHRPKLLQETARELSRLQES